jgi:hypothetical protein
MARDGRSRISRSVEAESIRADGDRDQIRRAAAGSPRGQQALNDTRFWVTLDQSPHEI